MKLSTAKRNWHAAVNRMGSILVVGLTAVLSWAEPGLRNVDCSKGEMIGEALAKADRGDTIRVTGTCRERATITTDRLTLDGQGTAVLDGAGVARTTDFSGLLTIDGARGVTVTGFTIQNAPSDGILALHAATCVVSNTTVQDNALMGIEVADLSTAELTDFTTRRNLLGVNVLNESLVIFRGSIIIKDNRGDGLDLFGRSTADLRGAHVEASNNAFGLAAINGQLVVHPNIGRGSAITATNNRVAGIGIGASNFDIFATITVTAENNGFGLFCPAGGKLLDPFGRGTFVFRNNGTGLFFSAGCLALVNPAMLTVQNNSTGMLADAADTLSFVTNPPNGSAISGNGTDVDLRFGTRATIQGITVGTIVCDGTILSRGSTKCP